MLVYQQLNNDRFLYGCDRFFSVHIYMGARVTMFPFFELVMVISSFLQFVVVVLVVLDEIHLCLYPKKSQKQTAPITYISGWMPASFLIRRSSFDCCIPLECVFFFKRQDRGETKIFEKGVGTLFSVFGASCFYL